MATSSFKSTTSRTPIGAPPTTDVSGSSASSDTKAHRRSRSLSRFSRRVLEPDSDPCETPAPPESKGKFVNKVRGSGFGDISLDDLAIEFFSLKDERESERGRSSSRQGAGVGSRVAAPTESSERRGRSVSRQRSGGGGGKSGSLGGGGGGGGGGRIGSDASSRRRRSVSVVRCQISDSESDIDHPRNSINHGSAKSITGGNSQMPSLQKPTALSHRRLGRSLSQKDLSKNGYSSQSSALTDDEAKETCSGKNTIEKTIRAVYAQKKGEHPTGDDVNGGLYEAMRKELRYAVDEIKMELEHARVRTTSTLESESFLQSDNSNDCQAASTVRKSCTTKQEQSEKRNQDLVAERVLEKQHGRELPKIVRGLLPGPKSSTIAEKPSRPRKRINDRNRLSKRLSEEAEIYFEDFISNVEDTDFSSFDGERSDTSSTLGVTKTRDAVFQTGETETFRSPPGSNSRPDEMDGVNLPWLQWETSPSKEKRVLPVTPKSIVWDAAQELVSAQDPSGHSTGSWSPGLDSASSSTREGTGSILKEVESRQRSEFDMDRRSKMKEMGLTEDEFYAKQFELKGEIPEPLKTSWTGPLVVRHVPPRDWPPRGWEVDREELEFIRGAHKLQAVRVDLEKVEEEASTDTDELCLERYKVFLKQYNEWVATNKDRLEKESYKYDQDYYPGRRKRGKDYEEGMYELPFYYPGQICAGKVTTLHLNQGAFVDIGGVHDGWVPIRRNDWYWLRHHIKVGMFVIVEILAKRDPYRFRFPIEMRFVDPNVDHLIFHKFEFPPIFHREDDTNPDELRRDSGRPPIPVKDPGIKAEEEPLKSNHPYVEKLWQIHNAEQMIMDDMEVNPDKYKDKKLTELTDDEDFDEENSVEYTKAYHKKALLPKMILKTSVKELDLEAALEERKFHNKLREEAKERGEKYRVTKLRRNIEMDEYDFVHWRRSLEEREALIRDISSRQALGLPLEEPGRFVDPSFFGSFGRDEYDPSNPVYRYDYWGEPKNTEKSRQQRLADAHTKSVVGKSKVWYQMSVEDFAKQQRLWEAQSKGKVTQEEDDGEESDQDDEDEYEDDDYIYSILSDPNSVPDQPIVVNGTESAIFADNRMYDN